MPVDPVAIWARLVADCQPIAFLLARILLALLALSKATGSTLSTPSIATCENPTAVCCKNISLATLIANVAKFTLQLFYEVKFTVYLSSIDCSKGAAIASKFFH